MHDHWNAFLAFVGKSIDAAYPANAAQMIAQGRKALEALPQGELDMLMLEARALLRVAHHYHYKLPESFPARLRNPVTLYLFDNLRRMIPDALRILDPQAPPNPADLVPAMVLLNIAQDRAESLQSNRFDLG